MAPWQVSAQGTPRPMLTLWDLPWTLRAGIKQDQGTVRVWFPPGPGAKGTQVYVQVLLYVNLCVSVLECVSLYVVLTHVSL